MSLFIKVIATNESDLGARLIRKCQLRYVIKPELPGIEFPTMVCWEA